MSHQTNPTPGCRRGTFWLTCERRGNAAIRHWRLAGELGFTSLANNTEINIADPNIAPYNKNCRNPVPDPEFHLSTPFSERNFLRLTAPPEFGPNLLAVLNSKDPSQSSSGNSRAARVRRGAQLFGIDLTAFANRMIPDRICLGRAMVAIPMRSTRRIKW
jgi:hypothetical protein